MGLTLAALEDLYRRRYRDFLRVALALLGDRDRAHDAVQETFARAIRARFGFRGEGTPEAWLWQMLSNYCVDQARRRTPEPEESARGNGYPAEYPEVRAALAALPERQRLVVFLRHYADLDYETIAEAAGIARGTVAATLHAGHEALRQSLREVPQ
jgi:RNA polymerase sigma-70 factor (ECF subfamily)